MRSIISPELRAAWKVMSSRRQWLMSSSRSRLVAVQPTEAPMTVAAPLSSWVPRASSRKISANWPSASLTTPDEAPRKASRPTAGSLAGVTAPVARSMKRRSTWGTSSCRPVPASSKKASSAAAPAWGAR